MSTMEKMPLLSVENLVVEYVSGGQTIQAVNGVSFSLERGQTMGLVGETGAGKTTVAKSILRILPDRAARVRGGKVVWDGVDLQQLPENEMQKIRGDKISMIFQDPMTALNPVMTIGKQVAGVIQLHNPIDKKKAESRAIEIFERVGITADRYHEYPHQCSGGMRQRVVIAMALAANPDLLLADEPTTALDVTIQAQVLDLIRNMREEQGISMLLITHDLGIVAENCDKIAVMYAGEIVESGTVEEVFEAPTHPYTIGLFGALPSMNSDSEYLTPIHGTPPDPSNLPHGCKFGPRCPYATEACRHNAIENVHLSGEHYCLCNRTDEIQKAKEK